MKHILVFRQEFVFVEGTTEHYKWHPANDAAELICKLTEQEYLFGKQIDILKSLGFKIYAED